MLFQSIVKKRLVIGCLFVLTNSALLAESVSEKRVQIGVRIRIADVVLENWNCNPTRKKEILSEMEKSFMEAVCREFKHWHFKAHKDTHSKYTLTLDVWEDKAGVISLLVWMDDALPNPLAVDERENKIIAKDEWLGPAEIRARLPNDEDTLKRFHTFVTQAFPEDDDLRKITIKMDIMHNVFPLAWDPKPFTEEENTLVLPLSKTHEELKKSLFCLRPYAGDPQIQSIIVEADGRWGKYSDDLSEALLAKIQDPTSAAITYSNPLLLIFLKEQRPVTDELWWVTNPE
jgi:hypothetical protein